MFLIIYFLVTPLTVLQISDTMGSPLHWAAECGASQACRLLLDLSMSVESYTYVIIKITLINFSIFILLRKSPN